MKVNSQDRDRLAVLIDAENTRAGWVEPLFRQVDTLGLAVVRRIYGDWTSPQLYRWKEVLNRHAIQPVQQFQYTTGKNCSDGALIVDAMDLLYCRRLDGFCLVTSDSDFTRLACRIRESGLSAYGFGEHKAPAPLVRACDHFFYMDDLAGDAVTSPDPSGRPASDPLANLVSAAYEQCSGSGDWVNLAALGNAIVGLDPSFRPKNHGFRTLSRLIDSLGTYERQWQAIVKSPDVGAWCVRPAGAADSGGGSGGADPVGTAPGMFSSPDWLAGPKY